MTLGSIINKPLLSFVTFPELVS